MKKCIFVLLILLIQNSYSYDYALILAGASRNDMGAIDNEFSRSALLSALASKDKGAESTLLFSGKDLKGDGKKSINAEKEQKNYKGDYDYVNKNFPNAKAATETAFLEALTKLEKK